uniref:Putative secreted protein n=1 Tax=Ixodes ricinus TaxID=34613 RepID=A0A6B0UG43_IXORI
MYLFLLVHVELVHAAGEVVEHLEHLGSQGRLFGVQQWSRPEIRVGRRLRSPGAAPATEAPPPRRSRSRLLLGALLAQLQDQVQRLTQVDQAVLLRAHAWPGVRT